MGISARCDAMRIEGRRIVANTDFPHFGDKAVCSSSASGIAHSSRRSAWMRNRYPLIEAGMSRWDCIDWWKDRYDRPLERSACVGCPFQSRQRWVETMRRWPKLFAEAVEIDTSMRGSLAFAREPYLHPRRVPLAEAMRLDQAEMGAGRSRDGFVNECEGHCGV